MADLRIIQQKPAALTPRACNPRTHSKAQIRQIVDSIRQFGFTNPVLVDRNNGIIAGHGRVEAAQQLGLETVPTICLADMSEAEIRAYVIADNRIAEKPAGTGSCWRSTFSISRNSTSTSR
jgi:ParB/RepB/Spo0J family partition protein